MPSLTKKCQLACVAYLIAQEVPCPMGNIFAGESSETKEYPEIITEVSQGEEDPPLTGNYWLDVRLIVRSSITAPTTTPPTNPLVAHDALCEAVYDAFSNTGLSAALTAVGTAFTANGQLPFRMTENPSVDHFETVFEGRIVGMGQTFPN